MELSGNSFNKPTMLVLLKNDNNDVVGAGQVADGYLHITHGVNHGDDKIGTGCPIDECRWEIVGAYDDEFNNAVKYLSE